MTGAARVWEHPETLIDVLGRRARTEPDAQLVTFSGSNTSTVGEIWALAEDTARALVAPATGLRPGDAVVTCSRPGLSVIQVLAGAARAGLVEVPLALDVPVATALATARATGAGVAVLGTGATAANPALSQIGAHVRVITVNDGAPTDRLADGLSLDDLCAGRQGPLPRPPSPGDPALVMSTSGTTGRPKGVLLPHFAGMRHARRVVTSMGYGPADVLFNAFPWNHINIRHAGLLAALASGARLVAVPQFSASSFWEICRAEGVTAFNFMGAVAAILLRGDPSESDREHQVTRAYGGPAPAWLCGPFLDRFGVRLIEAYACTELGDVTSNTIDDAVPGTAGYPLPEYDVQLLDDDGHRVGAGQVGRIAVRPRAPHITGLRYVGQAEGDAVSAGQWVIPGDRGRWDAGGRLVFAGRHSDVVRRRGENISTWDVESVVTRLPGVRDAAAVGVPSELTEEDLLVAVVPAGSDVVTADEVHGWCRNHLPRHAWPRYVTLLQRLPRNGNNKVCKADLQTVAVVGAATDFEDDRRRVPRSAGGPANDLKTEPS